MKLIVSRAAAADIVRLRAFLLGKNEAAARRVVTTLQAAIAALQHFPERGRPSDLAGARDLIVPFSRSAYLMRLFGHG